MAYVGSEPYLASWVDGRMGEDALAGGCIYLVGIGEEDPAAEPQEGGSSRGYIIRDWFGPFLLGPASSYLRGRC